MLTTTAMVLLSMTATVTSTYVSPTVTPTMTTREVSLFKELVSCGSMADKASSESYEAGVKDGIQQQYCFVQCKMLKRDIENLNHSIKRKAQIKKETKENVIDKIFGTYETPYSDDGWYEKQLEETKENIKKYGCECSSLSQENK